MAISENLKVIAGTLIGAAISGVIVWFYQDKRLAGKFQQELEDYKASYDKRMKGERDDEKDLKGEDHETVEEKVSEARAEAEKMPIPEAAVKAAKAMQDGVRKAQQNKDRDSYSKLTRQYDRRDGDDSDENGGEEKTMNMSERLIKNHPYYITEDEFYSGDIKPGWTQYECFYDFTDEGIYECNTGKELEGCQTAVGWDIMDDLKKKGRILCPLYVRNEELMEEYSIEYGSAGNMDPTALK